MPHELNSIMIKTTSTNDVGAGRPSIESFMLSVISSVSRSLLEDIKAQYPGAMTQDDLSAALSSRQALDTLVHWHAQIQAGEFHSTSAPICQEIDNLVSLARSGHSWIITSE